MADEISKFTLSVPQSALDDLETRIAMTRWPEKEPVEDWSQGVPLAKLRALVDYWQDGYDWRRCEAMLNGFGQFTTAIDGLDIHFIHARSPHQDALPLIITHGWPGSVIEFAGLIERLTHPEKHGGRAEDAFHVVAPSLPGFGFSGKPETTGWGAGKTARAWAELMRRLGYEKWVAQGGDWGSLVTLFIGRQAPEGCAGIHVNMPYGQPTEEDIANPDAKEAHALERAQYYQDWDSGYSQEQSTRPQTIGYSLVDSPVGLAGWIYEKMMAWTDNRGAPEDTLSRDQILDNIMLYWLPATGASAARMYWESFQKDFMQFAGEPVTMPYGASVFPKEIIPAPRKWIERYATNIIHWNEMERGGHFAAWEQPEDFAGELRSCFGQLR